MAFANEFERGFQEARQRVPPRPNTGDKSNGRACSRGNATNGVSLDDFYAYMPMHSYIYTPTREMWPAASVNSRLPSIQISPKSKKFTPASKWLDRNRAVEQMTWAPDLLDVDQG
jgi:hypothetical protein